MSQFGYVKDKVLTALEESDNPLCVAQIAMYTGLTTYQVSQCLNRMIKKGKVSRLASNLYTEAGYGDHAKPVFNQVLDFVSNADHVVSTKEILASVDTRSSQGVCTALCELNKKGLIARVHRGYYKGV